MSALTRKRAGPAGDPVGQAITEEAGAVLVGKEAVNPVAEHHQCVPETNEVHDVHKQPYHPGKEAAYMAVVRHVGHGAAPAHADYDAWSPLGAAGGFLAIHDVFEDPAAGGRPPYEVWCRAVALRSSSRPGIRFRRAGSSSFAPRRRCSRRCRRRLWRRSWVPGSTPLPSGSRR